MWDHYKDTFLKIQPVVFVTTLVVYHGLGKHWFVAATFFAMMQLGSIVGAWWGDRLKKRLGPQFH